jgi:hypothetical protein
MEVRQFSFCGLAAARCSSGATTSTRATGLGGGGVVEPHPGLRTRRSWRGSSGGARRAADAQFLKDLVEESHGDLFAWLVGWRDPAGLQRSATSSLEHTTDKRVIRSCDL